MTSSPADTAAFTAGAHRYAAEAFANSPFPAQRAFAPTLETWASNAERRGQPAQRDLFQGPDQ
ncbi:hypothetical protein [Brevundimonas sp. FT23028]|uniref:hypothetical protein n=1 Tax=Brevundimonas sp. FT23028 TaxID=3393748 RepID=UPI003B589CD9